MNKEDTILKKFGQKVRELRVKQGVSQMDLALKAGIDRTYVGGVERGERNISLRNIEKIAQALDTGIEELFKKLCE